MIRIMLIMCALSCVQISQACQRNISALKKPKPAYHDARVFIMIDEENNKTTKIEFTSGKYKGIIITKKNDDISAYHESGEAVELTWQHKTAFFDARELTESRLEKLGHRRETTPFIVAQILEKNKEIKIFYPLPDQGFVPFSARVPKAIDKKAVSVPVEPLSLD